VADAHGARLTIRVTPRASRSAFAGLVDIGDGRIALAVRLRAPPVEGAANQALLDFLAAELGAPRSSLRLVSGERSRIKTVAFAGLSPAEVARRLPGLG
jgi:uncharacterized protein (TIGR00251 family)